jgi:hypothetical protein
MRSIDKRLTEEDRFARKFACWANNHKGWSKTKKRNRRLARRKIRRGDWEGETMKQLLGFWLTSEAITIMIIIITGIDLDFIEMVKMVLLFTVFLTMLCVGAYLMVGA